jgi:transcriptional regulator with XRE-family HTH domain
MRKNGLRPGEQLRDLRFQRGMSMRDVQAVTERVAKQRRNRKLVMSPSRLSDLENEKVTPNIYRLYALSVAYRCPMTRLLGFYGLQP